MILRSSCCPWAPPFDDQTSRSQLAVRVMTRQTQPTRAEQQPCPPPQTGPEVHLQSLCWFSAGPGPQAPLLGNLGEALTSPGTQTPVLFQALCPVLGRLLGFSEQDEGCVRGQGLRSHPGTQLKGARGHPSQGSPPSSCKCVHRPVTWHSPLGGHLHI